LHLAVLHDHFVCAETLLSVPDIDVNAPNSQGATPLMLATERRNIRFVQLLVKASGIKVNTPNRQGWTAIMEARGVAKQKP
jgi:ankyrin repeat protein